MDEGTQPHEIKNINKTLNFDAVYGVIVGNELKIFAQAGITTSRFGYNGSGIPYDNHTGFTGQNIGMGAELRLSSRVSLLGHCQLLHYQQVDKSQFEYFKYCSVGGRFKFK
jgi:hypothetical protein